MTGVIDLVLCAFLGAAAWGAGTLAGPLAAGILGGGLGLGAWWASRRALPAAVPAVAVAIVGAHAIAAGPPPASVSWLADPAGVTALATVVLVLAALAGRRGAAGLAGPALAGVSAVLLLLAIALLLDSVGVVGGQRGWWRPLAGGAAGVAQALSLHALLQTGPRRRIGLCAVALVGAGVIALTLPGSSPPLRAPTRVPFVVR